MVSAESRSRSQVCAPRHPANLGAPYRQAIVVKLRAEPQLGGPCRVEGQVDHGRLRAEALALGTPVVGLSRGCLPELVEHGRTGWLAKWPDELAALIRAAGRIDPRECREQAALKFTPAVMAARYADLYELLISGLVPPRGRPPLSN